MDNPSFWVKLFSDSTAVAKEEGRPKAANHGGKTILFGELAAAVFNTSNTDGNELWGDFLNDTTRYSKSAQQQFQR